MRRVTISVDAARSAVEQALLVAGCGERAARLQANLLVEGELRGRRSHGLQRLEVIVKRLRAGLAQSDEPPLMDWVTDSLLRVDGRFGLGPVVCDDVLTQLIERTRSSGVSAATISNTNHLGMLALYVERAAREGLVCLGLTTSEALVHPWGGREALIGTNPIAIGIPARPEPVVIDLATSQISAGQVIEYGRLGKLLPPNSAVGPDGNETIDPQEALAGAISPFGGAKGYALGVGFELVVALLTGTAMGKDVCGTLDTTHQVTKGDIFIMFDPSKTNSRWSDGLVEQYLDILRSSLPAAGSSGVLIPGEGSARRRAEALEAGFTLPEELWSLIKTLGEGACAPAILRMEARQ